MDAAGPVTDDNDTEMSRLDPSPEACKWMLGGEPELVQGVGDDLSSKDNILESFT